MSAIGLEKVLREEAAAIHGDEKADRAWAAAIAELGVANIEIIAAAVVADDVAIGEAVIIERDPDTPDPSRRDILYRALNRLDSVALCLSGGGIRSASFALGIIQALAAFPKDRKAEDSLLAQTHYLSTVSGGGYIGSWLSAWLHRMGYARVWSALTGRPLGSDIESPTINWLRSYSNYLTPKLGALSADTWAAIALFLRNMFLNWFVLIPPLCAVLLLVKLYGVAIYNAPKLPRSFPGIVRLIPVIDATPLTLALFAIVILLIVVALRCALVNRPTCQKATYRQQRVAAVRHDDERAHQAPGIDDSGFLRRDLAWGALAAVMLCVWISARWSDISHWTVAKMLWTGAIAGAGVYALAWVTAWPPRSGTKPTRVQAGDFIACAAAGAVFGAVVGLGILALGAIDTKSLFTTLALAICGVPWIIMSQLTGEMIFVGLTSTQERSDQDREWFGRSTGWYAATAVGWFFAHVPRAGRPGIGKEHFSTTSIRRG